MKLLLSFLNLFNFVPPPPPNLTLNVGIFKPVSSVACMIALNTGIHIISLMIIIDHTCFRMSAMEEMVPLLT